MHKVVCCTSENYDHIVDRFPSDFHFLVDNTKNPNFDKGFTYDESKVRKLLNFQGDVSKKHYWNSWGNRNIIWFYAYFRMMYYAIHHKGEEYWFFDDDVKMDDWDAFFDGVKNHGYDFLSYFVFKKDDVESHPHIPVIDNRTTSGQVWFERFPGDGDILPNGVNKIFGSFFPVTYFTEDTLQELFHLCVAGVHGYGEGFVPTVLSDKGYKIGTIINSDSKSEFFDVDKVNILHKNIRTNWDWI